MIFEGFNESVSIKHPAEAMKVPPLSLGLMVSTQAVPVVRAGNETMQENNTTQAAATA